MVSIFAGRSFFAKRSINSWVRMKSSELAVELATLMLRVLCSNFSGSQRSMNSW